MDPRVVKQICNVRIVAVIGKQMLRQMQQQLTTNCLISVHVRDVLDIWFEQNFLLGVFRDQEDPQVASCIFKWLVVENQKEESKQVSK